jgi:hypothetical protein
MKFHETFGCISIDRAIVTLQPGRLWLGALHILIAACLAVGAQGASGPSIELWHGNEQQFGQPGLSQEWVNLLGTVSDPNGVAGLSYSLNEGPSQSLSLGPDLRRLAGKGDFNADIPIGDLVQGQNRLLLTAVDSLGNSSSLAAKFHFNRKSGWPLPYSIEWRMVDDLQKVVQEVDGPWTFSDDGVRPAKMAYDRVIAIGDMNWTEYEITVPITVNAIDPSSFDSRISNGPGIGIAMRWLGHVDWGNRNGGPWQPVIGWEPFGGKWWYKFLPDGKGRFSLQGDDGLRIEDKSQTQLQMGKTYMTRTRVEYGHGLLKGGLYRFKIWEVGSDEPEEWLLAGHEGRRDFAKGSLLLIAHHVDVTFGDIKVVPRSGFSPAPRVLTLASLPVLFGCFLTVSILGAFGYRKWLKWRQAKRTVGS